MTSEEIHELAILHGAVFTYAPALEEWWDFPPDNLEAFVRAVQEAERERILKIVEQVGIQGNHNEWFDCCDTIVERIKND